MGDNLNKKNKQSIFDKIELAMMEIKIKFLNKFVAQKDEYYSLTEPSQELMEKLGKTFWMQPYKEESEDIE